MTKKDFDELKQSEEQSPKAELYRKGKYFVVADMGVYEVYADGDRYICAYGTLQEAKHHCNIYVLIGK